MRAVGVIVGGYILMAMAFGALLGSGNPKPEYRQIISPNGTHTATLKYAAGFLGRDFTSVEITNRGCCEHFRAYEYSGPGYFGDTKVKWLDDSHLEIVYFVDPARSQECETRVADVTVTCVPRNYTVPAGQPK